MTMVIKARPDAQKRGMPVIELEDELITLTEAENRYLHLGGNRMRLSNLHQRGHLRERGRTHGPGKGGVILVSDREVRALLSNPSPKALARLNKRPGLAT